MIADAVCVRNAPSLTSRLLSAEPDMRASIARLGGVEALLSALRRHETSARVAEMACAILCNLLTSTSGAWGNG